MVDHLLSMSKTLGLNPRTQKEVTDPHILVHLEHCFVSYFCALELYLVHHRTTLNTVKHLQSQ